EPNKFKRWIDLGKWNTKCRKDHVKLLKRQKKFIESIKVYVETQTKARWVASQDEPAAIIATSDEEMDGICSHIDDQIIEKKAKSLSYERNTIYLRFSHSEYNKGTAAVALAKTLGITMENTFVIGDNYNDLKMLNREVAGMIACPANSVPTVKQEVEQIGGFVASKNYGAGTAEALSHFFRALLEG
ncbi:MAG: HAD hydrolase family protein, partial [Verrucomicrobiota bacterium]|nr:HAD hydrolase family protein [Verrucomicrobiota bacterium]